MFIIYMNFASESAMKTANKIHAFLHFLPLVVCVAIIAYYIDKILMNTGFNPSHIEVDGLYMNAASAVVFRVFRLL